MCEAISAAMATAGPFLKAAGVVMSAVSTFSSISAQQDAAAFNAQMARNNQVINERKAKDAEERGEREKSLHRLKVAQFKSDQTTTMAGQGFDVGAGTNVDLLADTEMLGKFDENVIGENSRREQQAYYDAANNNAAQASLYDSQADSMSPLFSSGVDLLAGGASVASRWYNK